MARRFGATGDVRLGGPSTVAWLVLAIGLLASLAGAAYWGAVADRDDRDDFEARVAEISEDLVAQLDRYHAALASTAGLFDASERVAAGEFAAFVERLDLDRNYRGIPGMSFVTPVRGDDAANFERALAVLGGDTASLPPLSPGFEHRVVVFTAGDGFESGVDLGAIGRSRRALDEARDTGQTVASLPYSLPTAESVLGRRERGFAIYAPIYRRGEPTDTVPERRRALLGWVATPAESVAFLAAAIGAPRSLGIEFVNEAGGKTRVVARHPLDLEERRAPEPEFENEQLFAGLGHRWTIRVESLPGFSAGSAAPAITLSLGVVISLLLFALTWLLSRASERRRVTAELAYQALHDPLTGLGNRTLFVRVLEDALDRAVRSGRRIAVLYIDLDHFKVVNDSLGHDAGDELLVETARRIDATLGSSERAARLGGDEFAVLREDIGDDEAALAAAEELAAALRVPYVGSDRDLFVPASIGVALSGPDHPDAEALLRNADLAMYHAKELGRDRCELFDDDLRRNVVRRLESEIALHRALDHHEFVVFYQPEVAAADGRIAAAEALLRWWHPELGPTAPADFIDIAEETGLIVPLGGWVLNEACRQAAAWIRELGDAAPPLVSVNLSARQVARPDLAATVARVLEEHGLEPRRLRLEITENVLMSNTRSSTDTVSELHDLGVHLGIDDFGTGYSSLSYLQRFPVDTLKIDQSFVQALGRDDSSRAIVGSVLVLAHSLGVVATAEGVETHDQVEELRALGCDFLQGNLLAPPQPPASFRRLLEQGSVLATE